MTIKKKTLKLGYLVEEKGKQVSKSYSYDIAKNIENNVAKEVGEVMATLIKDSIEEYAISQLEII